MPFTCFEGCSMQDVGARHSRCYAFKEARLAGKHMAARSGQQVLFGSLGIILWLHPANSIFRSDWLPINSLVGLRAGLPYHGIPLRFKSKWRERGVLEKNAGEGEVVDLLHSMMIYCQAAPQIRHSASPSHRSFMLIGSAQSSNLVLVRWIFLPIRPKWEFHILIRWGP